MKRSSSLALVALIIAPFVASGAIRQDAGDSMKEPAKKPRLARQRSGQEKAPVTIDDWAEQWSKRFENDMEQWAQQFERDMEIWAQKFEADSGQWEQMASQIAADSELWEDWAEDYAELWEDWAEDYEDHWAEIGEAHAEAWEDWAEDYAELWEDWAEHNGEHWAEFGESQAEAWEDWAEDYSGQWEQWGEEMEGLEDASPEKQARLIKGFVQNLSALNRMPIGNLQTDLLEQVRGLDELNLPGLAGIEEVIQQSVHGALIGLEGLPIDQDELRELIGQQTQALGSKNGELLSHLFQKRGRVREESDEHWDRLSDLFERLEKSGRLEKDGALKALRARPGQSGRALAERIQERLDLLNRMDPQTGRDDVLIDLDKERARLDQRDTEIDQLRNEVESLQQEIEKLRKVAESRRKQ